MYKNLLKPRHFPLLCFEFCNSSEGGRFRKQATSRWAFGIRREKFILKRRNCSGAEKQTDFLIEAVTFIFRGPFPETKYSRQHFQRCRGRMTVHCCIFTASKNNKKSFKTTNRLEKGEAEKDSFYQIRLFLMPDSTDNSLWSRLIFKKLLFCF